MSSIGKLMKQAARIQRDLGLDRPLHVQYAIFVGRLARGNLGVSARTSQPVVQELRPRLASTLRLALVSAALAAGLGILAGTLAATRPYSGFDYTLSLATLFGVSMPVYWLGLMLIYFFSVRLGWLPTGGTGGLAHYVMPVLVLASFYAARIARLTRSSVLDILGEDFILTARAKGLAELVVVAKHTLKNAAIPIVTLAGLETGQLLGGAVITETIFAWPGVGRLTVQALLNRDFPVVLAAVFVISLTYTLINLLVDLIYGWIDPRTSRA